MATDLGELIYTLTLSDAGFTAKAGAAKAEMKGMSAQAEESSVASGASLNKLAIGAAVVAVGIGVVADKTIKAAANFQEQLTTLVTGAGESEKNISMISQGLLKMSTETGETTKQLTDGLFMIESAGYHGAAGLDVLKAAAEGAKVGNADLGTVADATTTIMKDFAGVLPTQAVNTLIATVANGKTHMQDLAQSLAMILPTASAAGVKLNDVMGAMATMTGEGVPAANAATYLRQTLINLEAPGSKAVKALSDIGLSSKDVADELHKSLPDTLQMITDHLSKKFPAGSADYVAAIKDISGGSKTMQGMLDLTGQHMKDFQDNVGKVSDQVKEGGKSVVGWSAVQKDANFQMSQLKASVSAAGIAFGEMLLPALTSATKAIANIVRPVAEWVTTHQKLARTIVEVVGALATMILTVVAVGKAIEMVSAIMDIVAATNPIVLAIMAIALVAIVIVNYWSTVKKWFNEFWNWLKHNWQTILVIFMPFMAIPLLIIDNWRAIEKFFIGLWDKLKEGFNDLIAFLKPIGEVILAIILLPLVPAALAWRAFHKQIMDGVKAVGDFFAGIFNFIASVVVGTFNFIKGIFVGAYNFVIGVFSPIVSFFGHIMSSITSAIWNAVSGFGSMLFNAGKDLINGLIHGIENMAGAVMDKVKSIGKGIEDTAKKILKIFSPSQVFHEIGQNVALGLAGGITKTSDQAITATQNMTTGVIQAGSQMPNITNNSDNSQSGVVQYNFGENSVVLSTPSAVREFFNIGNRNTQLELAGGSPLAGTAGV